MNLSPSMVDLLIKLVYSTSLVITTYLFIKVFHDLVDHVAEKRVGRKYGQPLKHFITFVISLIGFLILLYVWGVYGALVGILAGAGFAGIVIGFAAKDVLSDLIAGILVFLDDPFDVDDWIEVDGEEGIVKDMTIYSVELKSFKGESVVVPNSRIRSEVVKNKSRNDKLRIDLDVGIPYGYDADKAMEVIEDYLSSLDYIESYDVVLKELSDSAVVLKPRIWIKSPSIRSYLDARTEAYFGLKKALEEKGITIPYPHIKIVD